MPKPECSVAIGTVALILALLSCRLFAQGSEGDVVESSIHAVPIRSVVPSYPRGELVRGREGWVVVSFVVAKDGNIIEPMIEDSSGIESFEEAAIASIQNRLYEPAQLDGIPVEQAMNNVKIIFALEDGPQGARPWFVSAYRRINRSIGDTDLETAFERLSDLGSELRMNLYEDAWYWWLNFLYLDASGSTDKDEMKASLRKAIGYDESYLAPEMFVAAAQRLYIMSIEDGEISDALSVFAKLRDAESAREAGSYEQVMKELSSHVKAVNEVVAGTGILATSAEVGRYGYWVHELLRKSFSLADVEGELELVDIRCTVGTGRYSSITEENVWTIPDGWEECGVYIKGREGSTFTLYEYPNQD